MDIDNLKAAWQNLDSRLAALERANERLSHELALSKIKAAKKKLKNSLIINGIACIVVISIAPLLVTIMELPVWLAELYGLFGLLMFIISVLIYFKVKRLDYIDVPVIKCMANVLEIRKSFNRARFIGITLGFPLVCVLFTQILQHHDYDTFYSAIGGAIVGVCIGIFKWTKQNKIIRELSRELDDLK